MSEADASRGCRSLTPQPHLSDSKSGLNDTVSADIPSKKERVSRYERPRGATPRNASRLDSLLLTTWQYRVVTREIVQTRLFSEGASTSAKRILTQSWRSGSLDKLRDRPINAKDVYFLSGRARHGLRRLYELLGEDVVRRRLKRPPRLDHALAVNNFRARTEVSSRDQGLLVEGWRDELDLADLAIEGVVPDASFTIQRLEDGQRRRAGFFLEAELAPVSRRHWQRRLSNYASFYYSHKYEAVFGLRSLRVLVVTAGGGRQPLSILEEGERLNFTPLRVTTWEQVQSTSAGALLGAPIWRKPFASNLCSLYSTTPHLNQEVHNG